MQNALEIIDNVLSQHAAITSQVTDTGTRMNDMDAIFSVQKESYKVAWSSSSAADLLEKANQLGEKMHELEEGLSKHFTYEEKVFPLVMGEILLKDILDTHEKIKAHISNAKTQISSLKGMEKDVLFEKRTVLLESVNELREEIINHAHAEENLLNLLKKVFTEEAAA